MTFEQAAALPQAGQLAVQGLFAAGPLRSGQKIVIDIRQDADATAPSRKALECSIRIGKWFPARKAGGKKARRFLAQPPPEDVRHLHGCLGEHIAIAVISLLFNDRLYSRVSLQKRAAIEIDAILARGVAKGIKDAAFPVDERAVTVECDEIEGRHGRGKWCAR